MNTKKRIQKLAKAVNDLNYLTTNKLFGDNEVYTNAKEMIRREAELLGISHQVSTCMVCNYK